jgi:DNA-binding response OmpR family regulator
MKTILMVEDDPLVVSVYGRRLRAEGYKFSAISDAEGALEILHDKKPDLLVVDLTLPGMDGIALIKKVRTQGNFLPMVVLTNAYSTSNVNAAFAAGATLCLNKADCTPRQLFETVSGILDRLVDAPETSSLPKKAEGATQHDTPGPHAGFRGVLRDVHLTDVVQFSCLARQSAVLRVQTSGVQGAIYVHEGKITHAVCGSLKGEAAFESLLGLSEGEFDLEPNGSAPEHSIHQAWEFLIMEAARKRDEIIHMPNAAPLALAATVRGELAIQLELRHAFLAEASEWVNQLHASIQKAANAGSESQRVEELSEIYSRVRAIASNAALAEISVIANVASAFEAFLADLCERPQNITLSSLRTVSITIDFLATLLQTDKVVSGNPVLSANVLAVDDEPLSRWAVTQALAKVNLKCVSLDSPLVARDLLRENKFDLVVLDIDMPDLDGLALCREMRAMPANERTPAIFVTSMGDFESRTRSILAGGNDLIAKPFLALELALKALIYLHKEQLVPIRTAH